MPTEHATAEQVPAYPRWPRYVLIAFVVESLLFGALWLADADPLIMLLMTILWVPTVVATAAAFPIYLWPHILRRR